MNFEDMPAASVLTMKLVCEKRRLRLLKALALGLLSGGLVEDDTPWSYCEIQIRTQDGAYWDFIQANRDVAAAQGLLELVQVSATRMTVGEFRDYYQLRPLRR